MNGAGVQLTISDERGVLLGTRTSSSAQAFYFWAYNAAVGATPVSGTSSAASTGLPNLNTTIAARKWGTGSGDIDQYAAVTISGYETGAGVNATKAQQIRDAWATLQNALGR